MSTTPPPLSLAEWAGLPLHRVVASAEISDKGALSPVGGMQAKAAAAARSKDLRALAVSTAQCWDAHSSTHPAGKPLGERTAAGLSILKAERVEELAQAIAGRLGEEVYGPVVPLPQVLTLADANKRFDYRAETFHPFEWLDALVADALHALPSSAAPGLQAQDPPLGELRKHLPKGYLHVLGTAGSGKTSWALNWARRSQGPGPVGTLPRLSGWYFARRFGASGVGQDNEQDEIAALQNLVSLARRQRDVVPARPLLLSAEDAATYRSQRHLARGSDTGEEAVLRERFIEVLQELVAAPSPHGPPSAESPLLFLIDGGDEMWGASARHTRWTFPRILPTLDQLPDHVYIVLLSRPGAHMLGFKSREPLLRYQFERQHVDAAISGYLTQQAHKLQSLYPGNDASDLLLNTTLQGHIARASGGAFGYAPLLMWQWHADRALEGHINLQAERLREWLHHPGSLPDGVYGLRAREFLDMQEKLEHQGSKGMTLARALALLTQLRWPLTQRELTELLYPAEAAVPAHLRDDGDAIDRLETLLKHGASWLSGVQQRDEALQFGHQGLAEVAQAAWRLSCHGWPLTEPALVAEVRALAAANVGEAALQSGTESATNSATHLEAQSTQDNELSAALRQQADAWLHADLAGRIDQEAHPPRWPVQQARQAQTPWLKKGQPAPTAWAYNLVWGPLHALTAAAGLPPIQKAEPYRQLAQRARQLLINAPYLQTAIRAQAQHAERQALQADPQALRQTYIMADKLQGDDPEQPLRHRVESAVLECHTHIASGAAQVGGVLWNLLGAEAQGKQYAQAWKASLDEPALITELPGTPSAFARRIPAKQSAVTECGNWLVTSDGETYTEVWDLRDGWHRAVVHTKVDWAVPCNLCVCTDGLMIGVSGSDESNLLLGWMDLRGGEAHLARYAGHRERVKSMALQAVTNAHGELTQFVLASRSGDRTVGLMVRSLQQVQLQAANSTPEHKTPNPGQLARYTVQVGEADSLALHAVSNAQGELTQLALACGFRDGNVGLLVRNPEQIQQEAAKSTPGHETPNLGSLARYYGHGERVLSVALHAGSNALGELTQLALASGSQDGKVGLLVRSPQQVQREAESTLDPFRPNPGLLALYCEHADSVISIALHGVSNAHGELTQLALVSGSNCGMVGLLVRSPQQIQQEAESGPDRFGPNPKRLLRIGEHRIQATSIAVRAVTSAQGEITQLILAGGSDDGKVGLLLSSPQEEHRAGPLLLQLQLPYGQFRQATYAGHRGAVTSIALRAVSNAQGELTQLALASVSNDGTVGLMVRNPKQEFRECILSGMELAAIAFFSWRSLSRLMQSNRGLRDQLARRLQEIRSCDLTEHYGQEVIANAWKHLNALDDIGAPVQTLLDELSRAVRINAVRRLPTLNPGQVLEEVAQPALDQHTLDPGRLALYDGHVDRVTAIALQAVTNAQGELTQWALASGSNDRTVGLLVRSHQQVQQEAAQSTPDQFLPNPERLALYGGHRRPVTSIALRAVTNERGDLTHLALGSGSEDGTVGLMVRSPQQVQEEAAQYTQARETPNCGQLALYARLDSAVTSIDLHAVTNSEGELTQLALASGSWIEVDLLVRSPEQVQQEADPFFALENRTRYPGQFACYGGFLGGASSITLQSVTNAQGELKQLALASGSWSTVQLLVCNPQQVQEQAAQSPQEQHTPDSGRLFRYDKHRDDVRSVALHGVTGTQGEVTHWALASACVDRTVGLWTMSDEDLLEDQAHDDAPREGIFVSHPTGQPSFVHLTAAAAPGKHRGATPATEAPLYWLGGDSSVAFLWQSTPQTGLQVQLACPYYAEGFKAMAFAQAPDRVHYMVGGAVGNDVAMLPLRLFDPAAPEAA